MYPLAVKHLYDISHRSCRVLCKYVSHEKTTDVFAYSVICMIIKEWYVLIACMITMTWGVLIGYNKKVIKVYERNHSLKRVHFDIFFFFNIYRYLYLN